MRSQGKEPKFKKILPNIFAVVLVLILSTAGEVEPATAAAAGGAARVQNNATSVQWQVGYQRVSFEPAGVRVAAGGRELAVRFLGARDALPCDCAGPATEVPPRQRFTYHQPWPGVDVTYETQAGLFLKSSFLVDPASAGTVERGVARIRLDYQTPLALDPDGGLRIDLAGATVRESAPVAWQVWRGRMLPVIVAFRLLDATTAGFEVGAHHPDLPLLIDPTLSWNTFLGGSNDDTVEGLTVDSSGNVYVVGTSRATWGSPVNAYTGSRDAYAAKLTASGAMVWNTFLGNTQADYGRDVAVDGDGNVYVIGESLSTWGSPQRAFDDLTDVFVAKLDADGNLLWNTFLGGSDHDLAGSVKVASSGSVYAVGTSQSGWASPSPIVAFHTGSSTTDAFLVKLNTSGVALWSTFMGSTNNDVGNGLALNASENVFVAGTSEGGWGNAAVGYLGGGDAFAAKFDSAGANDWSTFFGSTTSSDQGNAISVAPDGYLLVTGNSAAGWGTTIRNAHSGGTDAFVIRLTSEGYWTWNTFLGSSGTDYGQSITVTGPDVYVGGMSDATWGTPTVSFSSGPDVFAAHLNSSGLRQWHLFADAGGADPWCNVAVNADRVLYVASKSNATWGNPLDPYDAAEDGFIAAYRYSAGGLVRTASAQPVPGVTVTASNGSNAVTNAAGAFTVTGFITGTYVITPSLNEFLFSPATRTFTVPPDAGGLDFTATVLTYTVSGLVTDEEAQPLPGVIIEGAGSTRTTDASGAYTLTGVVAGTYAVTPTLAGYVFAPPARSVTVPPDAGGVDFSGAVITYSVSGKVRDASAQPVEGVIMALEGVTHTTDGGGAYTFTGVLPGEYSLAPALSEHTFSPLTRTITLPPAAENQDFTAYVITYSVSGTVLDTAFRPLPGVSVACAALTQTTDVHGGFSFGGLVAGTYWLTPTLWGYEFNPASQSVALGPSRSGLDYAGRRLGIFLPVAMVVQPDFTSLTVRNLTLASVNYLVQGTPQGDVGCTVPSMLDMYCGSFTSGTYTVRVTAPACDNKVVTGTVIFPVGNVMREVHCQ